MSYREKEKRKERAQKAEAARQEAVKKRLAEEKSVFFQFISISVSVYLLKFQTVISFGSNISDNTLCQTNSRCTIGYKRHK